MNITTDSTSPAPFSPTAFMRVGDDTLRDRQDNFAGVLSRRQDASASAEERATQAARDFVAVAFIQPVLQQLRDTNHAPPPYGPGPAEKKFRALTDAAQAQHLVKAANFPLVDRIASDMLRAGGRASPTAPSASTHDTAAKLALSALAAPAGGFAK